MVLYRFKLDKLVRDKSTDTMQKQGMVVHERILGDEELIARYKEKLIEEVNELVTEANTKDDFCEEFADVLEVINGFIAKLGIAPEEIEKIRQEKYIAKGGFERGLCCIEIELDSENPNLGERIEYFRSHPRYPEINRRGD